MVDVIEDVQFKVVRGNLIFKCYKISKYSVNEITAHVEAERRKGKRKGKEKKKRLIECRYYKRDKMQAAE